MNRELKFRVWNGEKMIQLFDPAIAVRGNSFNIVFTNNFYDLWHSDDRIERKEINECKVMQYTGLKDKNGKEIYEGDILKHPDGDSGFVRFDYGWAIQYSDTYSHDMPQHYCDNLEIIGNIYENKDKLK